MMMSLLLVYGSSPEFRGSNEYGTRRKSTVQRSKGSSTPSLESSLRGFQFPENHLEVPPKEDAFESLKNTVAEFSLSQERQRRVSVLEEEKERLEQRVAALQSLCEQLKEELAEKARTEEEKNQEFMKLQEWYKSCSRDCREGHAQIKVLETQNADQEQKILRLQKELEEAKPKIKLGTEIPAPKIVPALNLQAMIPAPPATVTEELKRLNQQIEGLRQQNQLLNKTIDELMEQLQQLQLDDVYSARVSTIMQTARSARPADYVDISALKKRVQELEREIEQHLNARKTDSSRIRELEAQVHLLKTPGVVPRQSKVVSGKRGCCS